MTFITQAESKTNIISTPHARYWGEDFLFGFLLHSYFPCLLCHLKNLCICCQQLGKQKDISSSILNNSFSKWSDFSSILPLTFNHFHFGEATQSCKQIPSCANTFHVEHWELPKFILSGTSTLYTTAQSKSLHILQSRFQCSKTTASSKRCSIRSRFVEQSLNFSESISINIAMILLFWT